MLEYAYAGCCSVLPWMAVDWVSVWVILGYCSRATLFIVSCRLSSTALAVPVPGCCRVLVSSLCAWNIGVLETWCCWLGMQRVGGLFIQTYYLTSNSASNLCLLASLELRNAGSFLILFIICSCSLKYRFTIYHHFRGVVVQHDAEFYTLFSVVTCTIA